MASLALALYIVYLILAFLVRGLIQWRRTGDSGMRFGTEAVGSAQWWSRLAFIGAIIAGVAAPVMELAGWLGPVAGFDRAPIQTAGLVLSIAGIAGVLVAQLAMGASWRVGVDTEERTQLVVRWPFTVVRNPIFTAMIVTTFGLALLVPSVVSLGAFMLLCIAIRHQVVAVEEPYLREMHGAIYTEYCNVTRRFLPW